MPKRYSQSSFAICSSPIGAAGDSQAQPADSEPLGQQPSGRDTQLRVAKVESGSRKFHIIHKFCT